MLVARALLQTVAELRDQGKCIVFSTHIMREAEKLCDRIAIMYRGQILAEGTLEEMRDRHQQPDLEELFFQLISRHDAAAASLPAHEPANVKLILVREIRDQLRDRRTLFMIAVLPLLLYPLLGISLFAGRRNSPQEQVTQVFVVGVPTTWPGCRRCSITAGFARRLFPTIPAGRGVAEARFAARGAPAACGGRAEAARQAVQSGDLRRRPLFPPEFAARLAAFHRAVLRRDA